MSVWNRNNRVLVIGPIVKCHIWWEKIFVVVILMKLLHSPMWCENTNRFGLFILSLQTNPFDLNIKFNLFVMEACMQVKYHFVACVNSFVWFLSWLV